MDVFAMLQKEDKKIILCLIVLRSLKESVCTILIEPVEVITNLMNNEETVLVLHTTTQKARCTFMRLDRSIVCLLY